MKATTRRTIFIIAAIALVILAIVLAYTLTAPKELGYSGMVEGSNTLESLIKEGKVSALRVDGSYSVDILLEGEGRVRYYANIPARSVLAEDVKAWADEVENPEIKSKITSMPIEYNDPCWSPSFCMLYSSLYLWSFCASRRA